MERLESRTPASTTLDLLLAGLMLGGDPLPPAPPLRPAHDLGRVTPPPGRPTPTPTPLLAEPPARTARPTPLPAPGLVSVRAPDLDVPAVRPMAATTFAPTRPAATPVGGDAIPATTVVPAAGVEDAPAGAVWVGESRRFDLPGPRVQSASVGGGGVTLPPTGPPPIPVVQITLSTPFVPVNANNKNGSPWKKDANGVEQVGLPEKRDFDVWPMPAGKADQDLKAVTITVTDHYNARNDVHISVGRIMPAGQHGPPQLIGRAWRDQLKTIHPMLPVEDYRTNVPQTFTTYLEGIEPSKSIDDTLLTVEFTTYPDPNNTSVSFKKVANKAFTVTPIVTNLAVVPRDTKPQFYRTTVDGQHYITGMTSGSQGNPPLGPSSSAVRSGFDFNADLSPTTNLDGRPWFMQVITNVSPWHMGSADGTVHTFDFTDGKGGFPRVDSAPPASVPFYPSWPEESGPSRWKLHSIDTPAFNWPYNGVMRWMQTEFHATLYLAWVYEDKSIYSLATCDWYSRMLAGVQSGQPYILDEASNASQPATIPDHTEPGWITRPVFNGNFQ